MTVTWKSQSVRRCKHWRWLCAASLAVSSKGLCITWRDTGSQITALLLLIIIEATGLVSGDGVKVLANTAKWALISAQTVMSLIINGGSCSWRRVEAKSAAGCVFLQIHCGKISACLLVTILGEKKPRITNVLWLVVLVSVLNSRTRLVSNMLLPTVRLMIACGSWICCSDLSSQFVICPSIRQVVYPRFSKQKTKCKQFVVNCCYSEMPRRNAAMNLWSSDSQRFFLFLEMSVNILCYLTTFALLRF